MGAEAGLWSTFIAHRIWSGWREDDYRLYARTYAAAPIDGKPKKYFVDMGNFADIYQYNETKRRDRYPELVYPETPEYIWEWRNAAQRQRFEDLRVASDRARNRSDLFLLGIVVNHIFSAANAALAARRANEATAALQLEYLALDGAGRPEAQPRLRVSLPW